MKGTGGNGVGSYNSVAIAQADKKNVGTTTLNPTLASKERLIAVKRFLKLQSNIRSSAALGTSISLVHRHTIRASR